MKAILGIIICCIISFSSKADLKYVPLLLKLSCSQTSHTKGEQLQLDLTFTNTDRKRHAIILPGTQHQGKKIIYFSFYSVKDNFYTEVARESREIDMDSIYYSQTLYKYLEPGASVSIPVFFGDTIHYKKHIEAHHQFPDLPNGKYEILACYDPWDEPMATNAFNKLDAFDKSKLLDTNKINLPAEGLISNYVNLKITDQEVDEPKWEPTTFCPKKCVLCKMIDKNNWYRVEEIIDDQTYYDGKNDRQYTDSSWRQAHRNIAWLGPEPDAILSSLPSYTSRQIIFRNAQGFHYFNMKWQIGIVYNTRAKLTNWIFKNRKSPIKLSEPDFFRLIEFSPY